MRTLKALTFIIIAQAAGIIGSFFTISSIESWYSGLGKPPLTPPGYVFGPAWILLYTLMGLASFLIWEKSKNNNRAKSAVRLYFIHLAFNAAWSILFFGYRLIFIGLLDIIVVLALIVVMIIMFGKIDKKAAWLMVPYLLWVSFATYLNLGIYLIN